MRTYYLQRNEDVSGKSGTGRVAQVAEFDDGTTIVHWSAETNCCGVASTEIFHSINDLLRVHGHEGRTVLEPILLGDNDRRVLEEREYAYTR